MTHEINRRELLVGLTATGALAALPSVAVAAPRSLKELYPQLQENLQCLRKKAKTQVQFHSPPPAPRDRVPLVFDFAVNVKDSSLLETHTMRRLGGLSRITLQFDRKKNRCNFTAFCWPVSCPYNGPRQFTVNDLGSTLVPSSLRDWLVTFDPQTHWLPACYVSQNHFPKFDYETGRFDNVAGGPTFEYFNDYELACYSVFAGRKPLRSDVLILRGECEVLVPADFNQPARRRMTMNADLYRLPRWPVLARNAGKPWQEWKNELGQPLPYVTLSLYGHEPHVMTALPEFEQMFQNSPPLEAMDMFASHMMHRLEAMDMFASHMMHRLDELDQQLRVL